MRPITTLATAVAVGSSLALAGCTTGTPPEPTTPATTSPSAGPSGTPSPTPSPRRPAPTRPAAMSTMDGNGAAAAAVYFIELYGYVLQTGDLTEWNAMSYPDCQFCTSTAEYVRSVHEKRERVEGGDLTAEILAIQDLDGFEGGYPVDLRVTQEPATLYSADGAKDGSLAGSTKSARFHTIFINDAWQIIEVVGAAEDS